MATINPTNCRTRDGRAVVIRSAAEEDAALLIALSRTVFAEGTYAVTEPDEFDRTEEQERESIRSRLQAPADLELVAEAAETIVGRLTFDGVRRRRMAHCGNLAIILAPHWRERGVGRALMQTLIDWAAGHPAIEKLRLGVLSTNARAIALYRKLGFLEEGRCPREIKLPNGDYVDDVLMYRFVKPPPPSGS